MLVTLRASANLPGLDKPRPYSWASSSTQTAAWGAIRRLTVSNSLRATMETPKGG